MLNSWDFNLYRTNRGLIVLQDLHYFEKLVYLKFNINVTLY